MAYQIPDRNVTGVLWQGIRFDKALDYAAAEMDDEISVAYYDHWRQGESYPWGPFDTVGDPAGDKAQFDHLTAVVQDMHVVAFHNFNKTLHDEDPNDPAIAPQREYRYIYDEETGEIVEDLVLRSRDRYIATCQNDLSVQPSLMVDNYKARVQRFTGYDIPIGAPLELEE